MSKTTTAVAVSAFHVAVIGAIADGQKAAKTMLDRMVALVRKQYGRKAPTYEQYTADQRALAKLAKDRGLASNQWVRKPYATAVKAVFGALPQNQSAEAARKRAARAAAGAKTAHVGRAKGETQDRKTGPRETAQQFVARIGIPKTLAAVCDILAADESTASAAEDLRAIIDEMKGGAPVRVIRDARKAA